MSARIDLNLLLSLQDHQRVCDKAVSFSQKAAKGVLLWHLIMDRMTSHKHGHSTFRPGLTEASPKRKHHSSSLQVPTLALEKSTKKSLLWVSVHHTRALVFEACVLPGPLRGLLPSFVLRKTILSTQRDSQACISNNLRK